MVCAGVLFVGCCFRYLWCRGGRETWESRRTSAGIRAHNEVTEQAQADGWHRSGALQQLIKTRFSTFAGTKLVEDSFQRGRQGGNQNKEMNPKRFFDRILRAELVGQIHKYKEVRWSGQSVPRGQKDRFNNHFFEVPMRSSSPALRSIVGNTATTKWYSPSPLNACHQDADLELVRYLHTSGMWDFAQRSWLCVLLRGVRVMIRRKVGDGALRDWMLVVGDLQGVAALCLPLVKVKIGHQVLYAPDHRVTHDQIQLAFILKLEDWEGMRCDWLSPLAIRQLDQQGRGSSCSIVRCMLAPKDEGKPLLQSLALQAFGKASRSELKNLAEVIGASWSADDDMYTSLRTLITHVFPNIDEADMLDILACRISHTNAIEAYLASGEADDIMMPDDRQEVQKLQKAAQQGQDAADSFATSYRTAARNHASVGGRPRKKPRAGAPKRVPIDGAITAQQLTALLPPRFRVWHDAYNSRWQLFMDKARVRNMSFSAYGVAGAAKRCAEAAWAMHAAYGGEACPHEFAEA